MDEMNHTLGTYHDIYSDDPDYRAEGMANDVASQVARRMEDLGVSRSALAEALGVNRAYVSKVLNAPPNLTLRSIAAVAIALGIKAEPKVILDPGDWIILGPGRHPRFIAEDAVLGVRITSEYGADATSNVVPFRRTHVQELADEPEMKLVEQEALAAGVV